MFSITLTVDRPICNCLEENIGWFPRTGSNGKLILVIFCRTCEAELAQTARMSISFIEPYPGKPKPTTKETKDLKQKDNVIYGPWSKK